MAWVTPPTFSAGQTAGVSTGLNQMSADLAIIGSAWTPYTPTLTNITLGNGTVTAKYLQVNKTVIVKVRFAAGSSTTYSAGTLGISAPVTPHTDYTSSAGQDFAVGSGVAQPTTRQGATVVFATSPTSGVFNFIVDNLASSNVVTNLTPGTFTTTSALTLTATYEAA